MRHKFHTELGIQISCDPSFKNLCPSIKQGEKHFVKGLKIVRNPTSCCLKAFLNMVIEGALDRCITQNHYSLINCFQNYLIEF